MPTSQSFSVNKLSQKGVAHIFLVIILLLGIISGVYLVQKTQIFKPKAYEIQDIPAESAQSSEEDYADWVTQMHSFGIYPAKEDGEIILYDRKQFVEKYCQPQGCILNAPPIEESLEAVKSDAKFIKALGDRLASSNYAPLTVLKPYFPEIINIDPSVYIYLKLYEPICRIESTGEEVCLLGGKKVKREISLEELKKFIDQPFIEDSLSEKDPLKRFITATDPIFGIRSLINVLSLPPNEVSDEERITALLGLTMVYGLTEKVTIGGFRLVESASVSLIDMIKDIKIIRLSVANGEAYQLSNLPFDPGIRGNWLRRLIKPGRVTSKSVKEAITVVSRNKSRLVEDEVFDRFKEVENIYDKQEEIQRYLREIGVPEQEIRLQSHRIQYRVSVFQSRFAYLDEYYRMIGKRLEGLVVDGVASKFSASEARLIYDELLQKLASYKNGELVNRIPLLNDPYLRDELLKLADNNWIYILKPDEYIKLYGDSAAVADGPFVVISENNLRQPGLLQHEFTHNISHHLRVSFINQTHFSYAQEQASKYGAVMSQIYELSTDLVVEELYGVDSVYRWKYPLLSKSIDGLINRLIKEGKGTLSRVDFMEFALTNSDEVLRNKISRFLSQDEFIALIDKEIDAVRLGEILEEAYNRRLARIGKVGMGATFVGEATILFSNYLTDDIRGAPIPQNAVITPDVIEFDQDQNLTR